MLHFQSATFETAYLKSGLGLLVRGLEVAFLHTARVCCLLPAFLKHYQLAGATQNEAQKFTAEQRAFSFGLVALS